MGKPLSMDLRSQAPAAVDEGMSCRALAPRFGGTAATVTQLRTFESAVAQLAFGHSFMSTITDDRLTDVRRTIAII